MSAPISDSVLVSRNYYGEVMVLAAKRWRYHQDRNRVFAVIFQNTICGRGRRRRIIGCMNLCCGVTPLVGNCVKDDVIGLVLEFS